MNKTRERIYVCHTFYHVYVAMLKECNLKKGTRGGADLALSCISTDFGSLKDRLEKTGMFGTVFALDEKKEQFFPELAKYRKNYNNIIKHLWNRMIFTKKLAKCEEPFMRQIDFATYEDIYVFCDSDPIGYYLNYKKLPYHAVEDGLDCLKNLDDAYVANHGHFGFKAWMSKHNLIFIMNGWGKYCIDMEVNDMSVVPGACPNMIELPRRTLEQNLSDEDKKLFIKAFIEDADALLAQLQNNGEEEFAMFLTEPHPVDEEARKKVCVDIIAKYCQGFKVLIKPHPRDMIDYATLCPECVVIRGRFPIEVMNMFSGIHVKKAISIVTTAMDAIDFVEEKINLGASFWDDYEDPALHAYNKKAGLKLANDTVVREKNA